MTPLGRLMFFLSVLPLCLAGVDAPAGSTGHDHSLSYQVWPIGWVRKHGGKTVIEVEEAYMPALLGLDQFDAIWVLYWFDRNDTPERRSILQVHPRGDPDNPLRGVFATRAPVRPNLIALSRCRIISIRGNRIEIDGIDAFPDTPVLDIKP
ncbi:MAG: tRNA (N6-threonylcarbamoyladenosine(37)-N6)-methyltransferase TrmO [Candidatus Thiodiazotropha sp.]